MFHRSALAVLPVTPFVHFATYAHVPQRLIRRLFVTTAEPHKSTFEVQQQLSGFRRLQPQLFLAESGVGIGVEDLAVADIKHFSANDHGGAS